MISTNIELEEDSMLLNNVTKFHEVVIKITGRIDWTTSKMVNFHK